MGGGRGSVGPLMVVETGRDMVVVLVELMVSMGIVTLVVLGLVMVSVVVVLMVIVGNGGCSDNFGNVSSSVSSSDGVVINVAVFVVSVVVIRIVIGVVY